MPPIDRRYVILLCIMYAIVSGAMLLVAIMFASLVLKGLGLV